MRLQYYQIPFACNITLNGSFIPASCKMKELWKLLKIFTSEKNLLMKKFYDSTVESLRLTPTSIDIAQVSCHICGALRDLVPFVQFKKCEKYPWRSVNFSTFLHGCFSCFSNCTNGTKSRNAPHLSALCPAISTLENSNPGNDRFILYNCYAVLVKF